MKIGIIIGRIGGVDGVALETEKWIQILERLGHEVYLLSGHFEKNILPSERQELLKVLYFFSPECLWEQSKAFLRPDYDVGYLLEGIEREASFIAKHILDWIARHQLDMLVSQNASALPAHLSMGLGIKKAVSSSGIPVVSHDHDYAWERGSRYVSPHAAINELVDSTFPLLLPSVRHVVINTEAKTVLHREFNVSATLVPNVMDFDQPFGEVDEYNQSLLSDLQLEKDTIPLLQVTRIVRRKGIETAMHLVERLNDKKVKLIITGSHADDDLGIYSNELMNLVHELRLERQVLFVSDRVQNNRGITPAGHKIYSLSDMYAYGRSCTYFSTYEGFGNAFVEAVHAKKPIFVNNYKPVYWPDIGSKGFETVMIEDGTLTDEAVSAMAAILYDEKRCKEIGEFNYSLGKKLFSYDVLQEKLELLFRL